MTTTADDISGMTPAGARLIDLTEDLAGQLSADELDTPAARIAAEAIGVAAGALTLLDNIARCCDRVDLEAVMFDGDALGYIVEALEAAGYTIEPSE